MAGQGIAVQVVAAGKDGQAAVFDRRVGQSNPYRQDIAVERLVQQTCQVLVSARRAVQSAFLQALDWGLQTQVLGWIRSEFWAQNIPDDVEYSRMGEQTENSWTGMHRGIARHVIDDQEYRAS